VTGTAWDAIVIGSGFGGAVTAARLARGGMRVLVIERGPWWGPAAADHALTDGRPLPRGLLGSRKLLRNVRTVRPARDWMFNRDGLYEIHRFAAMTVLSGSGVGGGSHVYAGIQRQPAPSFWSAFPPELTAREMSPHFERVQDVQRPAPSPTSALTERIVPSTLRRAGMTIERPALAIDWNACKRCGLCVLGCTHGAKTTLDLTYLLAATTAGACIRPLSEVARIEQCTNGFQISGMDHRTGTPFVLRGERLVVAAGTLNTARLLFTARDRDRSLPAISPALGRNFSGNADYPILVRRTPAAEPSSGALVNTAAQAGPTDPYYVDADIPIPVASAALRRAAGRYRLVVGMGSDGSHASLTLRRRVIAAEAGRHHELPLYDQMDADAAAVRRNGRGAIRSVRRPPGKLVSAHPLGGATIAASAADGVVDHGGRVSGYRRLYVADGSLLPAAPGVPPSLTIAALAERQASMMLQEG